MDLFKGRSASERNKIVAAIVLGVLALASLVYAFGPGLFSRGSTTTAAASPTPKPSVAPTVASGQFRLPEQSDQYFDYMTTPVTYSRGDFYAPDPGRNIFAFYEPPPPTPWSPTPIVVVTPKPPTPTPTPPYLIGFVMPQSVYAGSRGFRLEVNGDMFTPDAKIYFSQTLLPTTFVSPLRLTADVPANLIAGEGPRQIIVQSLDGKKYSQQVMLNVQAPPKPQMLYIGMYSGKFGNNDTAYFVEANKVNTPGTVQQRKRLGDMIENRFRLVSISKDQVIVQDKDLPFSHQIPLYRPAPGATINTGAPTNFPPSGFPGFPANTRPGSIPGFPTTTIPAPRPNNSNRPPEKKSDDEDDDGDGN